MSDYWKFLSSYAWRKTRARIVARDGGKCVICDATAKEVHHHEYDEAIMRGERDDLLVSLCESCHGSIEFSDTQKRHCLVEKRHVFEVRKFAYTELKHRGVDLVFEQRIHRKGVVWGVKFLDIYWKGHFVGMGSLLWMILCSFRSEYGLSIPRRLNPGKFATDKGISLMSLPSRKPCVTIKHVVEHGEVFIRDEAYPFPFSRLRGFLENQQFEYRIKK